MICFTCSHFIDRYEHDNERHQSCEVDGTKITYKVGRCNKFEQIVVKISQDDSILNQSTIPKQTQPSWRGPGRPRKIDR